jgi:PAS domain S-box-containing protein
VGHPPFEQLGRQLIEESSDCVKLLDLDARVLYLNPAGVAALELDGPEDMLGRIWVEFWAGEHQAAARKSVAGAVAGQRTAFEGFCRTARGSKRWWDVVITPITDDGGAVVQLLAVSRDITARRQEAAFRAGQQEVLEMIATGTALDVVLTHLVRLVERHSDGMWSSVLLLDEDGAHLRQGAAPSLPPSYNEAIEGAVIGARAGSCGTAMFLGRTVISSDVLTDPIWEDYRELAVTYGFRACWSAPIFSTQKRVLGSFAMYYPEPRTPRYDEVRMVEVAANIAGIAIEHQRAQEALRQSEERNRAILRAIPDWMFILDADGVFLDYHAKNPEELLLPPHVFLGKTIREVMPPVIANPLAAAMAGALASDEPQKFEYALESDQALHFYEACVVRCDGNKILSIVRDISDRKRAEMDGAIQRRELAHLSRVTTLGELSGALAHELSQPMSAILINAQAARRLLARDPIDLTEVRAAIDDIIANDKRAGAVIERLRTLLKKGDIVFEALDLNEVALEVLDLTRSDFLARRISVTTRLAPALPRVDGDRVQLQQVLLNLVLNACESMSTNTVEERRLTVTTDADDRFVQIAISDRGVGIPADQRDAVFEPFVTFREQGLGLGLAISRSIILTHGGRISAENNTDRGATFRCAIPIRPDDSVELTAPGDASQREVTT